MLTNEEKERLVNIKKRISENSADDVSREDRQWVLDIHKRERVSLPEDVYLNAKAAGFDVEGIEVVKIR